jgi:ATP citrate (pro-S)-lyase
MFTASSLTPSDPPFTSPGQFAVARADEILFTHQGGIDVGDVDATARRLEVPVDSLLTDEGISAALLRGDSNGAGAVPAARIPRLAAFIRALHECFVALHFCYLEINPLVVTDAFIAPLDLAAKLDECARFECAAAWGGGRQLCHQRWFRFHCGFRCGLCIRIRFRIRRRSVAR